MKIRLAPAAFVAAMSIYVSASNPVSGGEIQYVPEGLYHGKELLLRVESAGPLQISETGKEEAPLLKAEKLARPELRDVVLRPDEAGQLELRQDEKSLFSFELLAPSARPDLRERDGFLERKGRPVILWPELRLPPKLDRRWETPKLIRQKFLGQKPDLPPICWVGDSADAGALLSGLGDAQAPRVELSKAAWFEVHDLLLQMDELPKASFWIVSPGWGDLERGMSPELWLLKWHFFFQCLEAQGPVEGGLLIAPSLQGRPDDWGPWFDEHLSSLARSYKLRYVNRADAEDWQARLFHYLKQHWNLP